MGRRDPNSNEGETKTGTTSGPKNGPKNGPASNRNRTSTGTTETGGPTSGPTSGPRSGTEEAILPKLVTVNVPNESDADAEKRKKAAERQKKYRDQKKGSASKTKSDPMNTQQIEILLVTLSSIIAARPGMQVWAIAPEEAKQLVTPLAAIMAKHNVGEQVSEYADYIALATACMSIFIPKFLMWSMMRKEEQNHVRQPTNTNTTSVNENGTNESSRKPANRPATNVSTNVGRGILELIPASIGPSGL